MADALAVRSNLVPDKSVPSYFIPLVGENSQILDERVTLCVCVFVCGSADDKE
jgi:hypothetical protein